MKGIAKHLSKVRRGESADVDELVPLAISSDSDDDMAVKHDDDADTFKAPHKPVNDTENGFHNGDIYKEKASVEEEPETRCGYRLCRPDALQTFNNPKALLAFLCFFSMAQGFVVNGINNVSTTSVERRFQLPSSRVGMISSSYDFSAAILGIFISYMGSGRQKARWLTMASITMSVGSLVMALPHFTSDKYQWGQDITLTCSAEDPPDDCNGDTGLQNYLYVLILGQLLHGLGGTTLYTVGVSLIDDTVPANSSPMYIGILYAFATLGPALGYILGGKFLAIYVDFDTVSSTDVRIGPGDPRWVGAWWVGFVIASVLFILAAVPLSMYGAELPSAKQVRENRVSEMHGDDGSNPVATTSHTRKLRDLKHLPKEIIELLKNPTFLFVTLAGCSEGLITSGFSTFMPKFIQNQFSVSAGWAAMLTGFMAVPGAAGGQFFGGYLCKRLNLRVKGSLRIAIVCSTLSVVLSVAMWAKCDYNNIAGVTQVYSNSSHAVLPDLAHSCNSGCHCKTALYEPVCDIQTGMQYFSPCHAGCNISDAGDKTYSSCACVEPLHGNNSSMVTVGKCASNCHMLYVFLPIVFFAIFLLFMPSPPAVSATLRCIHDSQRTLGLGLKWFIVRLLGTVPGPILFGTIIDSSCIMWREKCGEHASCWIYDNDQLSRNFFILVVCFKLVSISLFVCGHQFYKAPQENVVQYSLNKPNSKAQASVTIVSRESK